MITASRNQTSMNATVSSSQLSTALGLVSRAVSPRSTLPVLGNVLLETAEDGLRITATNLELTIAMTVAAEIESEGRTTVPARLLSEYIGSLGDAGSKEARALDICRQLVSKSVLGVFFAPVRRRAGESGSPSGVGAARLHHLGQRRLARVQE